MQILGPSENHFLAAAQHAAVAANFKLWFYRENEIEGEKRLSEGNLLFPDIHWVGSDLRSGHTVGTEWPYKPLDEICTISPGINCGGRTKKLPARQQGKKRWAGVFGGRSGIVGW